MKKAAKKKSSVFGLFTSYDAPKVAIEKSRTGYCIRTKQPIPLNSERPYCITAYNSWNKYNNPNYTEKYCHQCGKENKSTFSKPICYNCYSLNKNN